MTCPRCHALIADLAAHEDFCSRVWARLPFQPCGASPPPGISAMPCHARKGHPEGQHIYDATWRSR